MIGGGRGYTYANLGGNAHNINIQKQRASIGVQDNVSGLAGVKEAISDAASAYTIGKALDAGKRLIDETADVIKDN